MNHLPNGSHFHRPKTLALVVAFALVYLSWGTTYLAIKEGVKNQHLPPAMFGGVRVCLAGFILLGFLAWRGKSIRLPRRDLVRVAVGGMFLFIAGNGLITFAERTVPSGVAAVVASTTPLWMGLLGMFWPGGDKLSARGWLGLVIGLSGVLLLLAPSLEEPEAFVKEAGTIFVFGSACSWALGSLWLRHKPASASHLSAAAYQMVIGGGGLALIGLGLGEASEITQDRLTVGAAVSFFYLLVVGSLVGFVAYNWLLRHVPATQAGTCAYVNPLVAILVGWLWGNEDLTGWIVGGMAVILAGVALVRAGGRPFRYSDLSAAVSGPANGMAAALEQSNRASVLSMLPGLREPGRAECS
jgi:drug/metabolite transporter (DMT)-like permease